MAIRIGANPLSWMNSDIPSLGAHIPVEQCLSEIQLIGFQGVELEDPLRHALAHNPKLLQHRSLPLIGGWHGTHLLENDLETEKKLLLEHIRFIRRFGGTVVNAAEVTDACHRNPNAHLSSRRTLTEEEWPPFCQCYDELAKLAKDEGMTLAYHQHIGTVVQSENDIDTLMRGTRHVGLLYDPGHLIYAQCNHLRVLDKHVHRIAHIHAKNVRWGLLNKKIEEDRDFPGAVVAGVFTTPGDNGVNDDDGIDFLPVVQRLVDNDYDGWLVMEAEQDPAAAHPLTYARLGFFTLQYLLAKARVQREDRERGGQPGGRVDQFRGVG